MASRSLLELDAAVAIVRAAAGVLPAEELPLGLATLGRVLAEDVIATAAVPPFDGSAMDGFAVRAGDLAGAAPGAPVSLEVIGESRAGEPAATALRAGEAVAISTGAVIPAGADAVVPVEQTVAGENGTTAFLEAPAPGAWVRRAGEDIAAGSRVLARGTRVGAAELGVLASVGRATVRLTRRPAVSLLVTGDELLGAGEEPRAGAIRDSNSLTIQALVQSAGGEVVDSGALPDERTATQRGIAAALERADVAIICGGVSVGVHDHVRPALAALGVRELFWGVALKPGRPTWFGTRGRTLVFGLPGNPVSAMVTFVLLAAPALRTLLGSTAAPAPASALLDSDYAKTPGRAHAVRCRLRAAEDGLHAQPTGAQGSHILTSMLGADALALIPAESEGVRAGERVRIEPLGPSLLGSGR